MKQSVSKVLYLKSGGQCALCRTVVVHRRSDGTEYHTGETAHIKGKKPKALRHDSTVSDEEINDISNLIMLCPHCHTKIDKNDTDYTVERIIRLKEDHEIWVRTQLGRESSDGFQVDLIDCVHIEENEHLKHHVHLSMSNKTTTTMRISGISLLDDAGKELEFDPLHLTEFELRGKSSTPWLCYCISQPKVEGEIAGLILAIKRRGKREFRKRIESMLVSKGEFPIRDIITLIDW